MLSKQMFTKVSALIVITLLVVVGAGCPPEVVPTVAVPNVVGMTESAAETLLAGVGLSLGDTTEVYSVDIAEGDIVSQCPPAGDLVFDGEVVTIILSLGTQGPHATLGTYEGSKTCNGCHADKAAQVINSVHYQWQGSTPEVTNILGEDSDVDAGKLNGVNGFCVYPGVNFIGMLTNEEGAQVSGGCSKCHVGLGEKPTLVSDVDFDLAAEKDKIDCLMCHSEAYKRKVAKTPEGVFYFTPDEENMAISMQEAMADIKGSSKALCLRCHATAGGGPNNKRGDIEPEHANPTHDLDVHMASVESGGAGLECIDCHNFDDHKVAGRGMDLRPTDKDAVVMCDNCHTGDPHVNSDAPIPMPALHLEKINCTVCHIPSFARGAAGTDMYRSFGDIELHPGKKLYEPIVTREGVGTGNGVEPVYAFWDGTSFISNFGDAVTIDPDDGKVIIAEPNGDVDTPGAQLFPFKLHNAEQHKRLDTDSLAGYKMGLLFMHATIVDSAPSIWNMAATNQEVINAALVVAAKLEGSPGMTGADFELVDTKRYMGLYHEVAPAEQALTCMDCHSLRNRMNPNEYGFTAGDGGELW